VAEFQSFANKLFGFQSFLTLVTPVGSQHFLRRRF